jgi:PPE-repeat protein
MFSSAAIISGFTSLSTTYPCAQINFTLGEDGTLSHYPDCIAYYNGTNPGQRVVVTPNFDSENPIEIAAALGVSFGTAGWLALWIHAILIEVYVSRLSPYLAMTVY